MKPFVDAWLKTVQDAGLWKRLYALTIGKVVTGEAPAPPQIGSVPGS
jgi:glutamate transport system substrate-binding protein